MIARARAVGEVLPVIGFYLQPAVGGRVLSRDFWQRFAALDLRRRHQGRAVRPLSDARRAARRGAIGTRRQIALYTGNDNNILGDLLSPYALTVGAETGGCCASSAGCSVSSRCGRRVAARLCSPEPSERRGDANALARAAALDGQLTDANAAIFDVANDFHGCIAGHQRGARAARACSPAAGASIRTRICRPDRPTRSTALPSDYPHLTDDRFVAENLDRWLR